MGVFVVDADVLARASFGTSQLAEVVGAMGILVTPDPLPWHQSWRRRHHRAWRERLAADPIAAALVFSAFGAQWTADFLTVPPDGSGGELDTELAELASMSDRAIRRDLEAVRRPLPAALSSSGLAEATADLVRWVWTTMIEPTWERRQRVLRADVVARTSRLSRDGWSGVFDDMRPGMRWLGNGELQINALPNPPRDIRDGRLVLTAAHCRAGWVTWRLRPPARYGIVYPVTGIFANNVRHTPEALAALIGPARARVLMATVDPVSTSALVALTGMTLGGVGGHLKVLLDAGLVQRRRSGREVFYWWTEAAHALVPRTQVRPTSR